MRSLNLGITHPCPSREGNIILSRNVKWGRYALILIVLVCLSLMAGCKDQNRALVTAHNAVGELLMSTQGQARALYAQGIIDERTYEEIRVNWNRARESYLDASGILDKILSTDTTDISGYAELITQTSNILSDIALWLGGEKI